MLERFLGNDGQLSALWRDLGEGAPTLIALAQLCSQAIVRGAVEADSLSLEARTLLYAARDRGMFEVKGSNTAYESPSRVLTVFVETDAHAQIRFRHPREIRQNIRFLEGFRELCGGGLVMHHLYHEFSLTSAGFELAQSLTSDGLEPLLELGQPCLG
jgi:hypothetical protein